MNWRIGAQTQLLIKSIHHVMLVTQQCSVLHLYVYMYVTDYSEFEDESLNEKGDEWLPLGKSFQKHINLFVRYAHSYAYILSMNCIKVSSFYIAVAISQKSKLNLVQKELLIALSKFSNM